MSMIETGLSWLDEQRHTHLSRTVSYSRGGGAAVEIDATKGRSTVEGADEEGLIVSSETVDFIVRSADLDAAGFGLPESGDRIEETVGGATITYEVCHLLGQPPWRYSDPACTGVRIHTRAVGRA